jgi:hypothetical protein
MSNYCAGVAVQTAALSQDFEKGRESKGSAPVMPVLE